MAKKDLGKLDRGRARRSPGKYVTTRSGRVLKVHRSLSERWIAMREGKSLRKVNRLRGLPKSRFKRLLWHLDPRNWAEYWFSRDGAIMALKITGVTIVALFILTLGVFAFFRKDLPDISVSGNKLGGSISYYDRTGKTLLWQDYDAIKRVPVPGTDISQFMKDATVAVEDRDFYKHRGFDPRGIVRAAFNDIFKKGGTQGGSTITQQLVKLNQDWTEQRSIARKIKEVILAVELERSYKKDDILTGYLNTAPYGGVDYGVQAAASDYFHKSAKDLNLAESAMLATIPKSPSIYSPYNKEFFDREAFIARYNYALDSMVQIGKIKKEQAEEAKKVDVLATVQPQSTKYAGIKYPYFLLAAKNELTQKFVPPSGSGAKKIGGWKVITTLDLTLQDLAETQVQKGLAQVKRQGGDTAALAAQDVKTGQMVALVGGADFTNPDYGQINYAQTPLPPGSSFKPYDYAALIENSTNAGAGSVLYDVEGALPGYPCTNKAHPRQGGNCLKNYDFRQPGPLSLRYALGGSRNIPAVKAILTTGVDKTIKTAEALGLKSGYKCYANTELTQTTQCYGAAGIGDGAFLRLDEHVQGLATLSRMGQYIPKTYLLKIFDSNSDTKPFYEWKQPKAEQAVRADTAYIVTDMLSDPNASYFPAGQKIHRYKGWNFALKTGTTNDAKDGWLMGYSTKYAIGVWVGHHSRQKAMSGFMENMTRPIWTGWMNEAHNNLKPENWTQPSSVQVLPAYVVTTHVGIGSIEPSRSTDLYPSWYKPKGASNKQNTTMDKVSNKVASSCTPELAKQNVSGNAQADQFSIDIFYGANATSSSGVIITDDIHNCSDGRPAITLTTSDNGDGTYSLTATATAGTHPFNNPNYSQFPGTLNFSVDGQVVKTYTDLIDSPSTRSYTYSVTSGSHSVTAQIIDSVLYDATTDPATIVNSAPAPEPVPDEGGQGGGN
ncbi:MAG: transglycosylase domain-containing protein [Patescibacteria group bacterium]